MASLVRAWRPFEALRRDVDRLFEDFIEPVLPAVAPARVRSRAVLAGGFLGCAASDRSGRARQCVRADSRDAGLDEKNISVDVARGVLTVKGHKEEDKVEKSRTSTCASGASARSPARFAFSTWCSPLRREC